MELIERVARGIIEAMNQDALSDAEWALCKDDGAPLCWAKAAIRAILDGVDPVGSFYVDDYGLAYRKDDGEPWKPLDYTKLYSLDALKEAL